MQQIENAVSNAIFDTKTHDHDRAGNGVQKEDCLHVPYGFIWVFYWHLVLYFV